VPEDRPDPWGPEDPGEVLPGDLIEDGAQPSRLRRRWTALPPRARALVVASAVVLAAGAGGVQLRSWAVERELAERVEVSASVGVFSSSTTPPGGQVRFFFVLRNDGARPVRVTSVEGAVAGLVLRSPDDLDQRVRPGDDAAVPISARLTCAAYDGGEGLTAVVGVRRQDGAPVTRTVPPADAGVLLDVASTLCAVLPGLRDRELSGPVLDDVAER
jgi:hypothetical protein